MTKRASKPPRPLTPEETEQVRIARQCLSEEDAAAGLKAKAEYDCVRPMLNNTMVELRIFRNASGVPLSRLQELTESTRVPCLSR